MDAAEKRDESWKKALVLKPVFKEFLYVLYVVPL